MQDWPGPGPWPILHNLFSLPEPSRQPSLPGLAAIISLIGSTETDTGLTVHCGHGANDYPSGANVSDSEMAAPDIRRVDVHGNWNCTLPPTHEIVAVIA